MTEATECVQLEDGPSLRRGARAASTASSATCVGVRPTRTPLLLERLGLRRRGAPEPDTIAPAWPMVLPGGAVKPAM